MSPHNRRLLAVGAIASLLGIAAGAAELVAGTVSWAGNKNDPVILGWVTVGLGLAVGAATVLAARSRACGAPRGRRNPARLRPARPHHCRPGLASGRRRGPRRVGAGRSPRAGRDDLGAVVRAQWTPALVVILAAVYLAFGIVDRGAVGLLGILGAVATVAALAVRRRSRPLAAGVLVVGAVPFAAATAWTLVTPLTAALLLLIGLPFLLDRTHPATPPRKSS